METNSGSSLLVEATDGVEVWTLNYPPVNAIGPQSLGDLRAQLDKTVADAAISVVVLASGLRLFSAGADASWMAEQYRERGGEGFVDDFAATMDRFRELCLAMRHAPVLFIAAMNGHTLAGGLELAAACDLRFVADNDRIQIGVPEMRHFGVMPSGGGGAQFLTQILGRSRALYFILDGGSVTPQEAFRLGLVDRLVAPDRLLEETTEFARRVARQAGRIGIAAGKEAVMHASELPFDDAMARDRIVHWESVRTGNFLPGIPAFIEQFASAEVRPPARDGAV